ncbi:MAG TPA: PBP1A family penicillin-binding protein [Candidatus Hydrogenedentes bacterium]|nr:PBP1A family penicillin-binding protein [Candidatus Hydrogenedentota bacterium]
MSDQFKDIPSLWKRMNARGCGFLFFLFMLVAGAAFGSALGFFSWRMEKAKAQIESLDQFRPKIGSKVYADGGAVFLGEYNVENRQLVRLNEIPLILQKAVVAAEDAVFYQHKGVRPDALFQTGLRAMRTGRVRGASTITMQLVRNAEEATGVTKERTPSRKLLEMIVALQVEREFTKDEILELYLNQVFLGGSAHGVEAAAQQYFGKSCKDVTLQEAATIAAILPSPNAYRPDFHPDRTQHQRNLILDRMLEHGFITAEEFERARGTSVKDYTLTQEQRLARMNEEAGMLTPNKFRAPYFVREMKIRMLQEQKFDDQQLIDDGYEIVTTLDMRLQKAAEEALFEQLRKVDERKLKALQRAGREEEFVPVQGALVCMDNRPEFAGYVRALVGGRNWEEEQFNMATQAARQPGSSVKPFVWAAALEHGRNKKISPTTIRVDGPFTKMGGNGQVWSPRNFSGDYSGPVSLRLALEKSINTVAVRLTEEFGVNAIKETIQECGFSIPIPADASLTVALGSHSVTALEQCAAYAMFPNGGKYAKPIFIEAIKDRDGLEMYRAKPKPEQRMKPDVAFVMLHMMRGVCESPWGTGGRTSALKRPRAGKTGTSNDARDVWFCGFTPEYTCVVWIGYKDNRSLGQGADYTGGRLTVPVWTNFMMKALEGQEVKDFKEPEGANIEWHKVTRQTSRGSQGGFNEAFIKGTYAPPAPPAPKPEDELDSIERQMEQNLLLSEAQ